MPLDNPCQAFAELLLQKESWEVEQKAKTSFKSDKVTGCAFFVECFNGSLLKSSLVALSCKSFSEDTENIYFTSGRAQTIERKGNIRQIKITTTLAQAQGLALFLQKLASQDTPSIRRVKLMNIQFEHVTNYKNFGITATAAEIHDGESSGYETIHTSASESSKSTTSLQRLRKTLIKRVQQQQRIEKLEQNVFDLQTSNAEMQKANAEMQKANAEMQRTIADLQKTMSTIRSEYNFCTPHRKT